MSMFFLLEEPCSLGIGDLQLNNGIIPEYRGTDVLDHRIIKGPYWLDQAFLQVCKVLISLFLKDTLLIIHENIVI